MGRLLRKLRKRDWRRELVIGRIVRFLKILQSQRNSVLDYPIIFVADMIEVIRYNPLQVNEMLI